jgi:hypothetical protein
MMRLLFFIGMFFSAFSTTAQEYELIPTSKEKELFTTATMDTILSKVEELQHPTEIVYYQLSPYTTIKIFPGIKEIKNEEE